MRELAGRLRQHPERVLLGLVVAHLVLKTLMYLRTAQAPLVGDERYYLDAGRAFSNAIRDLVAFRGVDSAELWRNAVGSGWFMPGMGFVLTPLFLVVPDAGQPLVHGYLGVFTTALFLLAVRETRRVLGDRYAAMLLVFPGLVPIWHIFSFCAWGDLTAGILIVFLVMRLVEAWRGLRAGSPVTLRQGALLGLLAIAVVYFRSSALVLSVGLVVVLGIAVVAMLRRGALARSLAALAVAGGVFAALLAPWSIAVSDAMNGRVLTTTSVPTVLGNTFGDGDELCFGPCDPYSTIWFSPMRYGREVAREAGIGEVEALSMMSDHALQGVTPHSYSQDVLWNLGRYVAEPHRFSKFIKAPGVEYHDPTEWAARIVTHLLWWPVFLLAVVGLLTPYRRGVEDQVLGLLTKLGMGALLIQPFVHISGPRYWTTAGPLFAFSALLWLSRRVRSDDDPVAPAGTPATGDETTLELWLWRSQLLLVVATAVVAVGVIALALA